MRQGRGKAGCSSGQKPMAPVFGIRGQAAAQALPPGVCPPP